MSWRDAPAQSQARSFRIGPPNSPPYSRMKRVSWVWKFGIAAISLDEFSDWSWFGA